MQGSDGEGRDMSPGRRGEMTLVRRAFQMRSEASLPWEFISSESKC
jgi:hypothetical protein